MGVFHLPPFFGKHLTNETAVLYKSLPRRPLHMTQECGFINNSPLEEEHGFSFQLKRKNLVCNKIARQEHKGSSNLTTISFEPHFKCEICSQHFWGLQITLKTE